MVKRKQIKKLNIGSGYKKLKGYINIDKAKEVNPDRVIDIEKGLPFPNDYFDYIYSCHCLEHIRPDKWNFVLNEIGRVAKNGCFLILDLPFDNIRKRTCFDHYRTFSSNSFNNLVYGNRFYYYPFKLQYLNRPNKIYVVLSYIFSIFISNVHFEFKIIKNNN